MRWLWFFSFCIFRRITWYNYTKLKSRKKNVISLPLTPKKSWTCFRRHFTIFFLIILSLFIRLHQILVVPRGLFSLHCSVWGLAPWPRDQEPLYWAREILTTGPPGSPDLLQFLSTLYTTKLTPFQFTSQWILTNTYSHVMTPQSWCEHFYHPKQLPWALLLGQFFLHGPW